jgi:hypothetical protein
MRLARAGLVVRLLALALLILVNIAKPVRADSDCQYCAWLIHQGDPPWGEWYCADVYWSEKDHDPRGPGASNCRAYANGCLFGQACVWAE